MSRSPVPASAPPSFRPLPEGLPNRLADGSVIVALTDSPDFESWLLRTARGEYVKVARYRSRAFLSKVFAFYAADGGATDPSEAARISRLDRLARARAPKPSTPPCPADHAADAGTLVGVDLVAARSAT